MKKAMFFLLTVSAAITVSCSKNEPAAPEAGAQSVQYKPLTVNASGQDGVAKTALGGKTGEKYSVIWKAGDMISVNGTASKALESDVAEGQPAVFMIQSDVEAPYNVIYPASAVREDGKLTLSSRQKYYSGQFDAANAIMTGSGSESSLGVKMACSFVKLTIKRADAETLQEVKLYSYKGEALCGVYSVDCSTGAMTLESNGGNTVFMTADDGLAYDANGCATVVFSLPPALLQGGFAISVSTSDGKHMTCKAYTGSGIVLEAGDMLTMPAVTFQASANPFSGGSGTAEDPYLIATSNDLIALSGLSNADAAYGVYNYRQIADIDMAGIKDFMPMFPSGFELKSTYDGGNFKVENLTIDSNTSNAAFVSYLKGSSATIENLCLKNINVSGTNNVAAVCGFGYQGKVANCRVEGGRIAGSADGVGAIVARPYIIEIEDCFVGEGTTVSGSQNVGGLVGGGTTFATGKEMSISGCTSYANVSSSGNNAGGIMGGSTIMKGTSKVTIENCRCFGSVTAGGRNVGGIIGGLEGGTSSAPATSQYLLINNCAAYGNVTGTFGVAGIIGYPYAGSSNGSALIINCGYFGRKLESTANGGNPGYAALGGIVGFNRLGNGSLRIVNCLSKGFKAYTVSTSPASYGVAGILAYTSVADASSPGPNEVMGCYSPFATGDLYIDGAPASGQTSNYGGIFGLMSSASSSGISSVTDCWYSPSAGQAGPSTYALKKNTAAAYTSAATLLDNLNKFAAAYPGTIECLEWTMDTDGLPILEGMSSSQTEDVEIGGSSEGWGNTGSDGGNTEVPNVNDEIEW